MIDEQRTIHVNNPRWLDFAGRSRPLPDVIRFGRVLLFTLLALWLPATLHCKLEAAGVFAEHCTDAGSSGDTGCTDDACPTIEDALYKDSAAKLMVAAPAECHVGDVCAPLLALDRLAVEPALSPIRHVPPLELRVAWQFLTRAAPPARAPSLNS
jgi:hypothetical protein